MGPRSFERLAGRQSRSPQGHLRLRRPRFAPHKKGPETIRDLGAGVPTGTLTVFSGCAGLLIGFANRLLDEEIAG